MMITLHKLLDLMEEETGRRPTEGVDYIVVADNSSRLELILRTEDEGDVQLLIPRLVPMGGGRKGGE